MRRFARARALTLLSAALVFAGCASRRASPDPRALGSTTETIRVGPRQRSYVLHVPAFGDSNRPRPLVLLLHGYGGTAETFEQGSHFSAKADSAGFIVAYPNGQRVYGFAGPRHWAAFGDDRTDVDFIRALIDRIASAHRVDATRIYVGGFSNGAMMTYRLGAELAGRLAAIGAAAGAIGRRDEAGTRSTIPAPRAPLSVVSFHGLLDDVVPYDAAERPGRMRGVLPVRDAMTFWREHDGCAGTPERTTSHAGNLERETTPSCRAGTEVMLYTVLDGKHSWFTSPRDSTTASDAARAIDVTDLMWEFFSRHALRRE